jgi:hypothetical protein
MKSVFVLLFVFMLMSCHKTEIISKENFPSCLQSIIKSANPPLEVWQYLYNNQLVYLVKPDCCDQYEQVYTVNCASLCAPGGGLTGKGDGKCADFYTSATHAQLVWKAQ